MKRFAFVWVCLSFAASGAIAESVTLANGDKLVGDLVEESETEVVLQHPQLGLLHIGRDQIEKVSPPNPGLFGTSFMLGWTRRFDLGLNGQEGNTVSKTLTAGLALDYKDETKQWDVKGRYFFNENDDGDDDNNARLSVRRDWSFKDTRWFAAAGSQYQYDQFEAWRHRLVLFGGPGYHLIDTDAHSLDVLLGPAFTKEFKGEAAEKLEAVANLRYKWQIAEDHTLSLTDSMFTELVPDEGGIRNIAIANWSIRLSREHGLRLNLGIESEYETRPDPGDKEHDLKYFLALGFDI